MKGIEKFKQYVDVGTKLKLIYSYLPHPNLNDIRSVKDISDYLLVFSDGKRMTLSAAVNIEISPQFLVIKSKSGETTFKYEIMH